MFSRTFWLFSLFVLLLTAGAHATSAPPPFFVDPPSPLPPLALAQTSQDDDIRVVQLSPNQDAFIADGEGVRDKNFGKETFLLVGQFNDQVPETRTMVSFRWQPSEDFVEIVEATLFFGVADGANIPLPISVYYDWDAFDESRVTWSRYAYWGRVGPVHGELGEPGHWYAVDVTSLLKDRNMRYPQPIGFSIRQEARGNKFYKVSHSRESDPQLAPQLVIRYRIDILPPEVWFEPDPLPEWAKPGETFALRGRERPDPNRPFRYELEYQVDGGPWRWHHPNSGDYPDEPGKTVRYRLRGIDRLGNTSDWVVSTPVKIYTYDMFGVIRDPRGRLLPPVAPEIKPPPWWVHVNPTTQKIVARMTAHEGIVATARVPGYGVWEQEPVHVDESGTPVSFVLPPPDNRLAPQLTEDPDLWQVYGRGDSVSFGRSVPPAQGGRSLLLIAESSDPGPALFCYKPMLSLDDSLNLPVAGMHFYGYGLQAKDIRLHWMDEEGVLHTLAAAGSVSKSEADIYTPAWKYMWGDLTPFLGEKGQLCVSFLRPAPRYLPNWRFLYLDRLVLGSMPSELSLTLTAPPGDPLPGQTLPITLTLTNRSVYTATATSLHYTAGGEEGDVPFPSLAPGEMVSRPLTMTMPQEGELHFQAVAGRPEIDLTPEDNRATWVFILQPRHQFLPLVRK